MGNVACCKKPNELIEDKDLLKKSTIRKDIRLAGNQTAISNEESPFYRKNNEENPNIDINTNRNINTNTSNIDEENQIHDLEKNNIEKNKLENINIEKNNIENNNIENNNIERQSSMGPSDNLRKKKLKLQTQSNSQSPKNAYYSTYNTSISSFIRPTKHRILRLQTKTKQKSNKKSDKKVRNCSGCFVCVLVCVSVMLRQNQTG